MRGTWRVLIVVVVSVLWVACGDSPGVEGTGGGSVDDGSADVLTGGGGPDWLDQTGATGGGTKDDATGSGDEPGDEPGDDTGPDTGETGGDDPGGTGDETGVDTPNPGEPGAGCQEHADCYSGWCITTADGLECTKVCEDSCPDAFNCKEIVSGGEPSFICVPRWLHLCDPCTVAADCSSGDSDIGHYCIDFGQEGKFCGGECGSDGKCPQGYSCMDVPAGGGIIAKQCVPDSGSCDCSTLAGELELSTTCSVANEFGTCHGTRSCTLGGLGGCNALTPGPEACNGIDDDCNGATDDLADDYECSVTVDGMTCWGPGQCILGAEICNAPTPVPEDGKCDGVDNDCNGLTDDGFLDTDFDGLADCIDEDKDDDTIPNSSDNCEVDANTGQEDFDGDGAGDVCDLDDDNDGVVDHADCEPFDAKVHPNAIEACDGIDNDCNGLTDDKNCDDGNPCTDDQCVADGCVHSNNQNACDDGSVCTTVDKCQDGSCQGFATLNCDDNKPCTDDNCDPVNGCSNPYNNSECEDGSLCTTGDTCKNGWCNPGLVVQCNDNNPCTFDQCQPQAGCTHQTNDGAGCVSGSSKCPQGQCVGGSCLPKSGLPCQTTVDVDLCNDVTVAGTCDAAGSCSVTSAPASLSCPGCQGICIKCFIEICIPFSAIF